MSCRPIIARPCPLNAARAPGLIDRRRDPIPGPGRGHRGERAGPCQSRSGGGADRTGGQDLARVEPLSDPPAGTAGDRAGGRHLRRHGLLHQFRHRGLPSWPSRWRASTGPCGPSRPDRDHDLRGRLSRPVHRAIAAAGAEKMVKGFGPLLPGFRTLPWGDLDGLKAAMSDRTAADHDRARAGRRRHPPHARSGPASACASCATNTASC